MGQLITCLSVGTYRDALTRGQQYELLDKQEGKVRVRGDNSRARWFPSRNFDLSGGPAPILVDWWFDDPVHDPIANRDETNNMVCVSVKISNGDLRWLWFVTPKYLNNLLEPRSEPAAWGGASEPAVWGEQIVVIRDLAKQTVDWTLRYMNEQGELIAHSRLVEDAEEEGEDK